MVVFLGIGAATPLLLRPALGAPGYTRVRLRPSSVGHATFRGTVQSFTVNDTELRDRETPDRLPDGPIDVRARLIWPGAFAGTATIARIDGVSGDAILSLDARSDRIRADAFTHATAWWLRSPVISVPVPGSFARGDTVEVRFRWAADEASLAVSTRADGAITAGRYRPWHGWLLFNPFTGGVRFDLRFATWTLAWLAGWGSLAGWYVASGRRGIERTEPRRRA